VFAAVPENPNEGVDSVPPIPDGGPASQGFIPIAYADCDGLYKYAQEKAGYPLRDDAVKFAFVAQCFAHKAAPAAVFGISAAMLGFASIFGIISTWAKNRCTTQFQGLLVAGTAALMVAGLGMHFQEIAPVVGWWYPCEANKGDEFYQKAGILCYQNREENMLPAPGPGASPFEKLSVVSTLMSAHVAGVAGFALGMVAMFFFFVTESIGASAVDEKNKEEARQPLSAGY
jgi:hypothetical protein